jgi:ribosomal protein L7/L12/DNA-directed RNA polymerase subunit RPC12/RpoP
MSAKHFQCPSCGASLDYENSRALTMRCPYCNSSVIVPESLRLAAGLDGISGLESVLDSTHTAQLAEVARLVHAGKKLEAIKLFRESFQSGLKESKDAVEQMERGEAVDLSIFTINTTPTVMLNELDHDTYAEAEQLIRAGNKLAAVTLLRRHANMDLAEAKGTADRIEAASKEAVGGVTVQMNSGGSTLDAASAAEIQRLLQAGNKIAAIKVMREKTGLGLAEAKNAVEAIEMASKVAGFFGSTMFDATPMSTPTNATTTAENLVTVVDGRPNFGATVVGNQRRGGCSWAFWLLLIGLGIAVFAPLPWVSLNETLGLPANLVPANEQSLWQKYTTDFPRDLGVELPGVAPAPLLSFGTSGTGQGAFSDPRHVTLDGQGNLYVADYDTGRIQRFDESGEFQSLFRVEDEPIQSMAATREGDLYVIQGGEITLYHGATGELLDTIDLGGLFAVASSVSLAPDGSLLVATTVPDERVMRLSRSGSNTNRLNLNQPVSSLTGEVELSMFVAEDGVGNLYVLGRFNNTILKFNNQVRFLNQFGAAELRELTTNGIAVDSRGLIYVAQFGGVVVFNGDGRKVGEIATDGTAYSVAIGDNDTVWVVTSNSKVEQYEAIDS